MPARLGWLGRANHDANAWLLTDGERDGVADHLAVCKDGYAELGPASRHVGYALSELGGSVSLRAEVCIVVATTVFNYRPMGCGVAGSPVAYSGTF